MVVPKLPRVLVGAALLEPKPKEGAAVLVPKPKVLVGAALLVPKAGCVVDPNEREVDVAAGAVDPNENPAVACGLIQKKAR